MFIEHPRNVDTFYILLVCKSRVLTFLEMSKLMFTISSIFGKNK